MATDDTPGSLASVLWDVRDEDHAVLTCIKDEDNTVRAINKKTTLTRHQINYAYRKLANLELIEVRRPDGWTRSRLDNGEYRTHRKSKQARLTELGEQYVEYVDGDDDLGELDAERERTREEEVAALRGEIDAMQAELREHKQALQRLYRNQSRS